MATGYTNKFITSAPDYPSAESIPPANPTSIAGLEHALLMESPYGLTGDELIFAVYLRHKKVDRRTDFDVVKAAVLSNPNHV